MQRAAPNHQLRPGARPSALTLPAGSPWGVRGPAAGGRIRDALGVGPDPCSRSQPPGPFPPPPAAAPARRLAPSSLGHLTGRSVPPFPHCAQGVAPIKSGSLRIGDRLELWRSTRGTCSVRPFWGRSAEEKGEQGGPKATEPTSPAPHPGFQHQCVHAHACWCALCACVCGGARWCEHVLTKVAHVCPWACACTRAHRRCVPMSVCPQECVCVCLPIPPLRWGLCKHFSNASPWRRGAPPAPPLPWPALTGSSGILGNYTAPHAGGRQAGVPSTDVWPRGPR